MKKAPLTHLCGSKKIVVIGEAGSGKTELAMNLAKQIHDQTGEPVRFLDMDETKILYRARDAADELIATGVTFAAQQEVSEAPVVPYAVNETLLDPDLWAVMDVGGGYTGALCIGQFAGTLERAGACVYYVVNSYRAFSDSTERIQATMAAILARCHLSGIRIVSNPYLGEHTTAEQFWQGHLALKELLRPLDMSIVLTAVPTWLQGAVCSQLNEPAIIIDPYLRKVLRISPSEGK